MKNKEYFSYETSREGMFDDESFHQDESSNKLNIEESTHVISQEELNVSTWSLLKQIFSIAFPTILFMLSLYLQQTINMIFLGRKYNKPEMIEGIGLAQLYINCLILSIGNGSTLGFESLGANAFGVGKIRLFGVYFKKTQLISFITTVSLIGLHYFVAQNIIDLFSPSDESKTYFLKYFKYSIFYCLFEVQFYLNFRYLNIIQKSHITLIILFVSLLIHLLSCFIFVSHLDLNVIGIAISSIIFHFSAFLMTIIYIYIIKPLPESLVGFSVEMFDNWIQYAKYTIPILVWYVAFWLGFEIQALISLWHSDVSYTAYIILANIGFLVFTSVTGFNTATTILVGYYLGKGSSNIPKTILAINLILSISISSLLASIIYLLRKQILALYISEPSVLESCENSIIFFCLYISFDTVQNIFASVIRGCGKQIIIGISTIVYYYVFCISLSILLCKFSDLGSMGLWLSLFISTLLLSFSYICYYIIKLDFKKILVDTQKRLNEDTRLIIDSKED